MSLVGHDKKTGFYAESIRKILNGFKQSFVMRLCFLRITCTICLKQLFQCLSLFYLAVSMVCALFGEAG